MCRRIDEQGGSPNLRIEPIDSQIFDSLNAVSRDLVKIASYVYAADRLVRRGTVNDLGAGWKRLFHFVIPVRCTDVWTDKATTALLQDTLAFLSDDHYRFSFCKSKREPSAQTMMPFMPPEMTSADTVALFSGGMDSLAGIVEDVGTNSRRPVLVSHWPLYRAKARQQRVVEMLKERLPQWGFPHVQALVRLVGAKEPEPTQRSRSFLYLSLASAVANHLGVTTIRIYENGIVALNLPIWRQCVGAMDTRTAHPKFLRSFQELVKRALGAELQIENPFFFKTRADIARLLKEQGYADLLEATTSCSRIFLMPEAIPQCGICSQCIDRRIALEETGLSDCDTRYQHDVFCESLGAIEGKRGWQTAKAKTMAVGYVRTAQTIGGMPFESFTEQFPEVWDAVPYLGFPEHKALEAVFELQQRHAFTVAHVMERLIAKHASDLYSGTIPRDSLVGIIAAQEHRQKEIVSYVERISGLLRDGLPVIFQTRMPANENEVKDAAQGIFKTNGEDLDREFPKLCFALLGTTPDFSTKDRCLYIEVKYPRPKTRTLAKIRDEMTNKILQYQAHAGAVLYVLYDHHGMIPDVSGFCAEFQKYDRVYVSVVKK